MLARAAVLSVRVPPLRTLPQTDDLASSSSALAVASNARATVKSRQHGTRANRQRSRVKPAAEETLDGWGDFDSDRLLRDDNNGDDGDDEEDEDEGDEQGDCGDEQHDDDGGNSAGDGDHDSRRSRHPSNQRKTDDLDDTVEGRRGHARGRAPSTGLSIARPSTQSQSHQRQRTLAVTELEPSAIDAVRHQQEQALYPTVLPRRSVLRKPGFAHRVTKKYAARQPSGDDSDGTETSFLPRLGRGVSQAATGSGGVLSPRAGGLFGIHVPDTLETRATVFAHLELIWSLLCSRAPASQTTTSPRGAASTDVSTLATRRSTFECSLVLMKLCKTLGIVLSASAVPVSWSSQDKDGVAFEAFCDFVIRNAVQPAMQHFKLDRNLRDYLVTLDRILESLVTTDPPVSEPPMSPRAAAASLRMRELQEIRPVLPYWKKGITSLQRQAPIASNGAGAGVALVEQHRGAKPRPQPAQEARTLQDANIRLKLRLRKSWEPSKSATVQSQQSPQEQPAQPSTSVAVRGTGGLLQGVSGSSFTLEAARATSSPSNNAADRDDDLALDSTSSPAAAPPNCSKPPRTTTAEVCEAENQKDLELVCGHCQHDAASLWCSSCFAVFCGACWTRVHRSVVDTSSLGQRQALVTTLTARPLVRPSDEDIGPPPVDIVYLPTKAFVAGRRSGIRCHGAIIERPEHEEEDVSDRDQDKELMVAIKTTSLLPSLQNARHQDVAKKSMRRSQSNSALEMGSAMDSTANLVKALMLGTASSASVLGSTSSACSPSTQDSATKSLMNRRPKDADRRQHLTVAAVTLDAARLLG
ncbi:hypothetical protein P43SY_001807 [Pythium insidiosum]|uniref:B box-type domain-containing protein n=1 Tax=Pythium insidiosum TaxID=114742 RepID=A0AAD5Q8D2_PYTIN|nr:hypothetical protein P43SY_001807 [Pythium insidiosum]